MRSPGLHGWARGWAAPAVMLIAGLALAAGSCTRTPDDPRRVIVLGFDGMDHGMVTRDQHITESITPNLYAALATHAIVLPSYK